MAYEFKLPDLGEGLTEGEINRWLVAEGDTVAKDDPLLEVQTDKATVEIPSPAAGTVLKILVPEGEVAKVGGVLVVIGAAGEHLLRSVQAPPDDLARRRSRLVAVGSEPVEAARATPAVRQLARSLGVDLLQVRGSGPSGRVVEADVRAAASRSHSAARRIPIRGIRRTLVEHVERTQREIPAVTFVEECDFTGIDLGRLPAITLHVAAAALHDHPSLNARIEGDEIVYLDRYDLGIAVHTDAGLVVPVVRGCDALSVEQIEAEVRRLAEGARAGTLAPDEVRDSTFTVTSAGKMSGLFVTPLINHPEVAILGIHRVGLRPVVQDDAIVARPMGNVSVTFDHRVVDGFEAAAFCLDVIARLQA